MRYVEIMVIYWDGIIGDILQSRPEIPVLNGEQHGYKWGYNSLNEIITDL